VNFENLVQQARQANADEYLKMGGSPPGLSLVVTPFKPVGHKTAQRNPNQTQRRGKP